MLLRDGRTDKEVVAEEVVDEDEEDTMIDGKEGMMTEEEVVDTMMGAEVTHVSIDMQKNYC